MHTRNMGRTRWNAWAAAIAISREAPEMMQQPLCESGKSGAQMGAKKGRRETARLAYTAVREQEIKVSLA